MIFKIFSLFKMSATLSQPGKVAKQLIKQMGGVQGCRPFKIEGVRKLIAKYEPHESFTWGEATNLIFNNKAYLSETVYIDGKKLSSHELFKYLLKKEVFSAGLNVDCPNCTLNFWISIDNTKKISCL